MKLTPEERREVHAFYAKNRGKIPSTTLPSLYNPKGGRKSKRKRALRGTPSQAGGKSRVLVRNGIPASKAAAEILSRWSSAESHVTAGAAPTPSSGARQNQSPSDPGDTAAVDRAPGGINFR